MTKKEKKETKQEEVQETTEHAQEEVEISREDQLLNDLKRTHAEFENYRKRVERDRSEHSKLATKRLVIDLIDVLDNFSVSLEHKDNPEEFIKGTEMIYAQLLSKLEDEGLEPINVQEGDEFNPYDHEALMTEFSNKPKNTITKVIQRGYNLNGQTARHAKVIVSKGQEE